MQNLTADMWELQGSQQMVIAHIKDVMTREEEMKAGLEETKVNQEKMKSDMHVNQESM
jgi:hypothetical protein